MNKKFIRWVQRSRKLPFVSGALILNFTAYAGIGMIVWRLTHG